MQPKNFNEEEFDKSLQEYLRATGDLFPKTPEEISDAIKKLTLDQKLPPDLSDPFVVMTNAVNSKFKLSAFEDSAIEENLARAAREGGDIPDDIKKRMEEDRKAAEQNRKNNNADTGS